MSLSETQREVILEQAIRDYEAKGYYVKTQGRVDAKLIPKGRKSSTTGDILLTLGTAGLFAPLAVGGAVLNKAVKLHVDTQGKVTANGKPVK